MAKSASTSKTKSSAKKSGETPLMKQFNAIKAKHPDAILLFRVGDFYETFGDDAVKASKVLGIVLTKRKNGAAAFIDLAGFPHHSLDTYLPKLVRAGLRVAICDQLEDPKQTKTIVKRGVTELVTPGVTFNDKVLDTRKNNFLAAVVLDKKHAGVAFLDVSTGEFLLSEGTLPQMRKLLHSFSPNEVLYRRHADQEFTAAFGNRFYTYRLDDWVFSAEYARECLLNHFGTATLKGFGVEHLDLGVRAAGAALHYLGETKNDRISHISRIQRIEQDACVWLDAFTIRNLELVDSPHLDARTLLDVLNHTRSPMGARLLRNWVLMPLRDRTAIEARLEVVEHLTGHLDLCETLHNTVHSMGDLERLCGKVASGRINPKELAHLGRALACMAPLQTDLRSAGHNGLAALADRFASVAEVGTQIESHLSADPPLLLSKGGVMADGIHAELDELRGLVHSGKDYLVQIQEREAAATGIPSLKVAYNNVFGYYLEVRNAHKDKVPEGWVRKQTLTQAERYITEELKEYEAKILGGEEKILALESELFQTLVQDVTGHLHAIQQNARTAAHLDCLVALAKCAVANHYTRPRLTDDTALYITEGRHPVIEQTLPPEEDFVANDITLDGNGQQILMITGPNMSGKSALLRQTALITLMAQMGSFVPAKAATIGLVDKVFTRVGASDNISSGESTFMVEMNETASILNNATDRSLVLLDEIGRGTSTYDGISIAWAIAEYLHEKQGCRPRTLFATHYHELNEMAAQFPRIRNYNVAVHEVDDRVIFLRKLRQGGSNHSFGIHVAQMAGVPSGVVRRAKEILVQLERSHSGGLSQGAAPLPQVAEPQPADATQEGEFQLSFFQLDDPVLEQVREEILGTDINNLTPVEALMKLNEIKKILTASSKDQ